jgi:antitoxin HigA-1
MIKSFRHRGVERFFRSGSQAGIQPKHAKRLRLQLGQLDAASGPAACRARRLPGLPLRYDMARMHNPPHPGEVLQDTVLRDMTVTEFAKRLEVSRVAMSRVVNGRAAVSAELAIRLAAALGGSAESWLRMQVAYDLWQAQRKRRPKIQPIQARRVA